MIRFDSILQEAAYTREQLDNIFYHGLADRKFLGMNAYRGIHVGTFEAAREALNATIGIPVEGNWDGTRTYGETLLAGREMLKRIGAIISMGDMGSIGPSGYNMGAPEQNYLPTDVKHRAEWANGQVIPFDCKPVILKVEIVGPMSNNVWHPHSDTRANAMMLRNVRLGNAKRGYFYINDGEDAGSVSAVVPNVSFLKVLN